MGAVRDNNHDSNIVQQIKNRLLTKPAIAYLVLVVTVATGIGSIIDLYEKVRTLTERMSRTFFVVTAEPGPLERYSFASHQPEPLDVFPGGFEYTIRLTNSHENPFPVRLISLEILHEHSDSPAQKVITEPGIAAGVQRAQQFNARLNGKELEQVSWQLRSMEAGEEIIPSHLPNLLSLPSYDFSVNPGEAETIKARILASASGNYKVSFRLKYAIGSEENVIVLGPVNLVR